jgi:hypothetical protein
VPWHWPWWTVLRPGSHFSRRWTSESRAITGWLPFAGICTRWTANRVAAVAHLRTAATGTSSTAEQRYLLTEIARLNRAE